MSEVRLGGMKHYSSSSESDVMKYPSKAPSYATNASGYAIERSHVVLTLDIDLAHYVV